MMQITTIITIRIICNCYFISLIKIIRILHLIYRFKILKIILFISTVSIQQYKDKKLTDFINGIFSSYC